MKMKFSYVQDQLNKKMLTKFTNFKSQLKHLVLER